MSSSMLPKNKKKEAALSLVRFSYLLSRALTRDEIY